MRFGDFFIGKNVLNKRVIVMKAANKDRISTL